MSDRVYEFPITTPANTAKATPLTSALTVPPGRVDMISVLVPPGPRGNLGFYFAINGDQVIPYEVPSWIVTDNERLNFELEDLPTGGTWNLVSYNIGQYDHTIYIRLLLSDLAGPAETAPAVIPASSLAGLTRVAS